MCQRRSDLRTSSWVSYDTSTYRSLHGRAHLGDWVSFFQRWKDSVKGAGRGLIWYPGYLPGPRVHSRRTAPTEGCGRRLRVSQIIFITLLGFAKRQKKKIWHLFPEPSPWLSLAMKLAASSSAFLNDGQLSKQPGTRHCITFFTSHFSNLFGSSGCLARPASRIARAAVPQTEDKAGRGVMVGDGTGRALGNFSEMHGICGSVVRQRHRPIPSCRCTWQQGRCFWRGGYLPRSVQKKKINERKSGGNEHTLYFCISAFVCLLSCLLK